jgi:glycosyltransferase involved in cell wall biosynthesis
LTVAGKAIRVLYSFPHKIGADRICMTAWYQVDGVSKAGGDVQVFPGVLHRPFTRDIVVRTTLSWGKVRIPYKAIGRIRACALHDYIVSRRIHDMAGQIDVIHVWPLGALRTLKEAARLGIPTVLERANAHTRFAYEVVRDECQRLGVTLPRGHEHEYNQQILDIEEREYELADKLLCPSDFTLRTFLDRGFPQSKLARHTYGYDPGRFFPLSGERRKDAGLTVLFVGVCAVRKGLHFALEAWLRSTAHTRGTFMIAGDFVEDYRRKLSDMLSHPSVKILGHRNDVPDLMRQCDIMVLPSIEEGFGLVVAEAIGSGCVPMVSDACTEICMHMHNGLVHHVGDVPALADQFSMLDNDRDLLGRLRDEALSGASRHTWDAAGERLLQVYRETVDGF